jgi:hypothetical protein
MGQVGVQKGLAGVRVYGLVAVDAVPGGVELGQHYLHQVLRLVPVTTHEVRDAEELTSPRGRELLILQETSGLAITHSAPPNCALFSEALCSEHDGVME